MKECLGVRNNGVIDISMTGNIFPFNEFFVWNIVFSR